MKNIRGLFEKIPETGVWWIRYADATGRIRREKAGTKSTAIKLYQKRKTEILEGKKLPPRLRSKVVRFAEIADDALIYCRANNQGQQFDGYALDALEKNSGITRRKYLLKTSGDGSASRNGSRVRTIDTNRRYP